MHSPFLLPVAAAELQISAICAQGVGGQTVNEVSSAIHLRFDIPASSLTEDVKARLLAPRDPCETVSRLLRPSSIAART